MIFANPVPGPIYLTPSGTRFYRRQREGCGVGISTLEQALGTCPHFHRAIDIDPSDGRTGVDLLAAAAGKVIAASTLNDGAKVIAVYHGGGFVTGYAHCASFVAAVGSQVAAGAHIAEMGKTGLATGIHVHFIVKSDFKPTGNPLTDMNNLIRDDPKYGFSGISNTARGMGTWLDPWPLLAQNVMVHPKLGTDVNIRATPSTSGTIIAVSRADGRIISAAGIDMGASGSWRKWGGLVTGDPYTVGGVTSTSWEKMLLGTTYAYIASLLAVRSAA